MRVYRALLTCGGLPREDVVAEAGLAGPRVRQALETLARLRLVLTLPGEGGILTAISPDTAAAELVGAEEAQLHRRQRELDRIRCELAALTPSYTKALLDRNARETIDVMHSRDQVVALIVECTAKCSREVLSVQPGGGRPPELLAEALPRDLAMLERGVAMRTLYQHTARYSLPTQRHVQTMTEAGAQVRTLGELFGMTLIFDRETVFLPVAGESAAAVVLREPSAVAFLCGVFESSWSMAEPFAPAYGDRISTELQTTIVRLLAGGAKDELIARKLGMSLRTCRRHIADLMHDLGAGSRFQAGYRAGRLEEDIAG